MFLLRSCEDSCQQHVTGDLAITACIDVATADGAFDMPHLTETDST